jgi:uncharacterized protein (TIGR02284 family)
LSNRRAAISCETFVQQRRAELITFSGIVDALVRKNFVASKGGSQMNLVEILDSLISISVDGAKRYHSAALNVSRSDLENLFNHQAEERKRAADELSRQRESLGIADGESGTWRGIADRAALDASVALSKGDSGVVDWCRKDDEAVAGEYQHALDEDLPPSLRGIIEQQLAEIRAAIGKLDKILMSYGGPRS